MSKENRLPIAPWVQLRTAGNRAWVIDSHGAHDLNLAKLGQIAEWLAEAWENLAGEKYAPVIITEGGYVTTDKGIEVAGVVRGGEYVIPKLGAPLSFATALDQSEPEWEPGEIIIGDVERDCE